jgi:hypothetical protein
MQLTKKNNFFYFLKKNNALSYIYIFLILFNIIASSKINTSSIRRKLKYKSTTQCDFSDQNQSHVEIPEQSRTLNAENSLSKFAVGFFEGLIGNKTGWYRCLPDEYFVETPNLKQQGFVQEKFSKLSERLQKLGKKLAQIVTFVCYTVTATKAAIKLYAWIFKSSSETSFLEGKFHKRKPDGRSLDEWLSSVVKKSDHSKLSKFTNKMKNAFGSKFEDIRKLGNSVNKFRTTLKDFFNQPIVKEILCIGKCVVSVTSAGSNLYSIANAIDTFVSIGLSKVGFIYIAKFIWNLICNYEKFIAAVNAAALALTETSKEKYFYWGKVLGLIANILGTSAVTK